LSTWNVLQAAEVLGINKLVLASSVNAVGATWTGRIVAPQYFPIDEEHPTRAEDCYSLSKWVGEQIADGFARKRPDRSGQIASFRFHGLLDDERLKVLKASPITDPYKGAEGFWGYVHIKDAARACRLALEADWTGHHAFFINAEDTMLNIPTEEALSTCYPGVRLKKPLEGFASPLDCSKAKRLFGWEPLYSWKRV
jgi:UDP-glucose 4-epimerase